MRRVVFDFDGVINSYGSGWMGADEIPDPPVEGIGDVIDSLHQSGYEVVVCSARCQHPGGAEAISQYLDTHNIRVDAVMAEKPPAIAYVDDRAICFNGNTLGLVEQITNFKTWWEKSRASS